MHKQELLLKFIELAKKKEDLLEQLKELTPVLEGTMVSLGLNTYHQDKATGIVYKIIKPLGKFTHFSDIDYTRTKKSMDETSSGRLAKSEAEEYGFGGINFYKR